MKLKLTKLILLGAVSGLIAGFIVPILNYVYLEVTLTDPVMSQWNGIVLLGVIAYVPLGVIIGTVVSIALIKVNLTSKGLFALLMSISTVSVGMIYLFNNYII